MKWPVWFPYPRAFLGMVTTLASFFLVSPVIYGVMIISIMPFGVLTYLANFNDHLISPFLWIGLAWCLFVFLVLPIILTAHIHQLLYFLSSKIKNRPTNWYWIPPSNCRIWAVRDFFLFSFLLTVVTLALLMIVAPREDYYYYTRNSENLGAIALGWVTILLTYAYHIEILISKQLEKQRRDNNRRQNRQTLPRAKSKPKPNVTTTSPDLDRELERLKREMEKNK